MWSRREPMEVWKEELAKYPLLPEAVDYVKAKTRVGDLLLADFETDFPGVIERAEERVKEALERGFVSYRGDLPPDVELASFPLALALVKSIGDGFLSRRYALAEAERVEKLLREEEPEVEKSKIILKTAREVLRWKVEFLGFKAPYDYALSLRNYLEVAPGFHHEKWKLVNRPVRGGYVYLPSRDLVRLIAEGVKRIVEEEAMGGFEGRLPRRLREVADRIRRLLSEKRPASQIPELGEGEAVVEAFPPCVRNFYQALVKGESLPHVARFTVTSFLLNIGASIEDVVRLFTNIADADERITRYQVEHIAGLRGSKTKYTPPKCETLKTHGLCVEGGRLCRGVNHPLTYYRRALRRGKIESGGRPKASQKSV